MTQKSWHESKPITIPKIKLTSYRTQNSNKDFELDN
jgi:hypothetical protein